MSIIFLATEPWWIKTFQKVLWSLIYLHIQTQAARNFQVWFVASRFQSIFVEWNKPTDWEVAAIFLASESWWYQSTKSWFWYWLDWVFKLDNLRSYQFGFAHQRVSWKLYSCSRGFNWEVFFDSGIEVLMSKNALKVFSFESHRFSEYCFSLSRGLISSTEVSFENIYFRAFI